ncbi:hypothetical protein PanWU01x14_250140 [Parasponia andersonii]|uniref:Uncharacterized protein n=1 Tax=Parasponia andersonii TaxID=3476 RepID=A0A2P5BD62_PARAD|nr:hypothetical protein PanWU01x14_250140 [Parasponia andersonii]
MQGDKLFRSFISSSIASVLFYGCFWEESALIIFSCRDFNGYAIPRFPIKIQTFVFAEEGSRSKGGNDVKVKELGAVKKAMEMVTRIPEYVQ